jgi:hypothetical protein
VISGAALGADRHIVDDFADAFRGQESRDQDVRLGPIELLMSDFVVCGTDRESAPLVIVEDRREQTGRVKMRETKPVNRTGFANQRDRAEVADYAVVFNRLVSH